MATQLLREIATLRPVEINRYNHRGEHIDRNWHSNTIMRRALNLEFASMDECRKEIDFLRWFWNGFCDRNEYYHYKTYEAHHAQLECIHRLLWEKCDRRGLSQRLLQGIRRELSAHVLPRANKARLCGGFCTCMYICRILEIGLANFAHAADTCLQASGI